MLVLMKVHERKNCVYQGLGMGRLLYVFICIVCVCVIIHIQAQVACVFVSIRRLEVKIRSIRLSFSTLSFELGFLPECLSPTGQT